MIPQMILTFGHAARICAIVAWILAGSSVPVGSMPAVRSLVPTSMKMSSGTTPGLSAASRAMLVSTLLPAYGACASRNVAAPCAAQGGAAALPLRTGWVSHLLASTPMQVTAMPAACSAETM